MNLYGEPWSRTTIAKIETSARQVSVDELITLAFVLGVSPAALLVYRRSDHNVSVTPNTQTGAGTMWNWIAGAQWMGGTEPGSSPCKEELQELQRRYDEAVPDHVATAERRLPGVRAFARLASGLLGGGGLPDQFEPQAYRIMALHLAELEAQAGELRRRAERAVKFHEATEGQS